MAVLASVVAVATGFLAAVLLFEATIRDPADRRRLDPGRKSRMRRAGLLAAVVAVIAAYVAAFAA
jgi:hypothetical protein